MVTIKSYSASPITLVADPLLAKYRIRSSVPSVKIRPSMSFANASAAYIVASVYLIR